MIGLEFFDSLTKEILKICINLFFHGYFIRLFRRLYSFAAKPI